MAVHDDGPNEGHGPVSDLLDRVAPTPPRAGQANVSSPLALVLGFGSIGRQVASRLAQHWRVRVIDVDPAAFPLPQSEPPIELLPGDASSRLVLERAGLDEAACVIACIGDDDANLEACRIACSKEVPRVVASVRDADLAQRYEALGVEVVLGSGAVASMLHNRVEHITRVATGVGLGAGEIVEVTIMPESPAAGRAIRSLNAREWLIAAIYRSGRLVVPTGDTVVHSGDRLVVVGQVGQVEQVAELLRAGFPQFPRPYGERLAVVLSGKEPWRVLDEALFLAQRCNLQRIDVFATSSQRALALTRLQLPTPPTIGIRWPGPTAAAKDEPEAAAPAEETGEGERSPDSAWPGQSHSLAAAMNDPGLGCVVVGPVGRRASRLRSILQRARCPILLARGGYPYGRLLTGSGGHATAPTSWPAPALALARQWSYPLLIISARSAAGFGAAPSLEGVRQAMALSQAFRVKAEQRTVAGNPVRAVLTSAEPGDLLLLAHRQNSHFLERLFHPDVSSLLALRSRQSVLIFPWRSGE